MMYPRLKLARNLLKEDGLIFISIDDNEIVRTRNMCDEIFGEENFIAQFVWKCRQFTDARSIKKVSTDHEYILCYAKSDGGALRGVERDESKYSNPDNDPRGAWMSRSILGLATKDQRPNLHYSILDPNTGLSYAPPDNTGWRYAKDRMNDMIREGRILFPKQQTGRPREKKFRKELTSEYMSFPTIIDDIFTSHGTTTMRSLFDAQIFDFPKPFEIIEKLIEQCLEHDGIVIDFFAGSCPTAHAVFSLNSKDKKHRNFIMVQLPEPCAEKSEASKAGYKTISDIGKERIRRVAAKIKEENPDYDGDLGFKVFKLDSSNIRAWNPDRNDLEGTLYEHTEHLIPGRTEEDILYELLLKRGVDLTVPIEERLIPTTEHTEHTEKVKEKPSVSSVCSVVPKKVFSIGYGVLFACLDPAISREEVEELALGITAWHKELAPASDTQVVFRDSAFADDVAKTNMTAILEQNGIKHVR